MYLLVTRWKCLYLQLGIVPAINGKMVIKRLTVPIRETFVVHYRILSVRVRWNFIKYFSLKISRKTDFTNPLTVIPLSRTKGSLLPRLLFMVVVKIYILILFSVLVTCVPYFSWCFCWKSSSDVGFLLGKVYIPSPWDLTKYCSRHKWFIHLKPLLVIDMRYIKEI